MVDHDNQVAAVRSLKCKVPGTANGRVGPPAEVKGPAPDSMSKVESLLPAEAYIIKALIADPTEQLWREKRHYKEQWGHIRGCPVGCEKKTSLDQPDRKSYDFHTESEIVLQIEKATEKAE